MQLISATTTTGVIADARTVVSLDFASGNATGNVSGETTITFALSEVVIPMKLRQLLQ